MSVSWDLSDLSMRKRIRIIFDYNFSTLVLTIIYNEIAKLVETTPIPVWFMMLKTDSFMGWH